MNKAYLKYISLLSIVILSGISCLFANAIQNGEDVCTTQMANVYSGEAFIAPLEQSDNKSLVFEVTETQEIENEENVNRNSAFSIQNYLSAFFISFTKGEFSPCVNKGFNNYRNYCLKSSTKLHVRLQVFII